VNTAASIQYSKRSATGRSSSNCTLHSLQSYQQLEK